MSRPASTWRILLVLALVVATGCHPTQPFYLQEDGDLSHYLGKATQPEVPDVHQAPLADVEHADKPLTLSNPEFKEFWDLTLEDCMSIALNNTKIIRGGVAARLQQGQLFAGMQESSLVLGPRQFSSIYNPAIVESNPGQTIGSISNFVQSPGGSAFAGPTVDGGLQGNVRQGVEAALSDFDAQLSVTGSPNGALWNITDRPQNVVTSQNFTGFPQTLNLRDGGMQAQIAKRTAEGTVYFFRSITNYDRGNQRGSFQALNSFYTQLLEVEARQPLLRGRGAQVNRMPIILARIGADQEILGVQEQLMYMLNNVEIRYWDLFLAYRNLETAKVGRDSALVTWRIVYDKYVNDVEPVQAEAQAREQYFAFRAQVEAALRNLYDTENELRFLLGLAPTDGRLIRPKDDPTMARVNFEWCDVLAEAIARRPELIMQRWAIKAREMELILFRNQLLPQLDVGALYRWVGLGDDLIEADRNGINFPGAGSTAWENLTDGNNQEATIFLQATMPIGFRRELAGVRHGQLRLAREQALLEDMELDVAHGLTKSIRHLDTNFQLAQTNANRWAASQKEVEAMEALYRGGRVPLNDVLEAQRRRAQGQAAFWNAVAEYNKAIADFHTRKGSILEYNGICFEEGPWPQKAYWDALGRARERDAGTYIDYGWTRPKVISRGAVPQHGGVITDMPLETLPEGTEVIGTPQPTPAAPPAAGSGNDLPMPPLETRVRPAAPAVSAAAPAAAPVAAGPIGSGLAAAPAAPTSPASIAPASYSGTPRNAAGNPLRNR
ncbi:MAG: TolC family protein [Pirellulaceae bacterium]|nr:TolC family protein [Pirellulaceae bacterium]